MALTYAWAVSPSAAGAITSPGAQNTTFVCAAAGTASITLTVSGRGCRLRGHADHTRDV